MNLAGDGFAGRSPVPGRLRKHRPEVDLSQPISDLRR